LGYLDYNNKNKGSGTGKRRGLNNETLNGFVFVTALTALFVAFWWIRQPVLGIISVLLLGSNAFQLFETYSRINVFGWPISISILILALHLPLLTNRERSKYYLYTIPFLTGFIWFIHIMSRSVDVNGTMDVQDENTHFNPVPALWCSKVVWLLGDQSIS
jgi:hypothetical protein